MLKLTNAAQFPRTAELGVVPVCPAGSSQRLSSGADRSTIRKATSRVFDDCFFQVECIKRNVAPRAVVADELDISLLEPIVRHGLPGSILQYQQKECARVCFCLLLGLVHNPSPSQQSFTQTLCALSPDIATTVELAKQFYRMLRERDESAWLPWQKAARKSPLHDFVAQLQRDE